MKLFSFIIILLTACPAVEAQNRFRYSGTIHGLDSGLATLTYTAKNQPLQISAQIRKGHFHFSGSINETQRIGISFSSERTVGEIFFFAGNENISILADTGHWNDPVITGSKTQKAYELYQEKTKSIDEKSASLNREGTRLYLSGKLNEEQKDSLFKVHDQLDLEKRIIIADFAKSYPSSPVSSWAISVFYGFEPNLEELVPAYHSLSKENQQGIYGKLIAGIINAAKKTAIGMQAADFTLSDINGKPVALSAYRGKYLLVDFWASWCGPCRAENPNVVRMYKLYHSLNFDILGVSLDNNPDLWKKAIKNDQLLWTQCSDLKAWDSKIVLDYGIKGIPFNMLLDKNGRIIGKNLRGKALQNKLSEILDNPAVVSGK
jgi:peroxiredoxin